MLYVLEMTVKQLFESVLYLGLLGGAILFVRKNILDYIQGQTDFSTTHEHLTLRDLPSLVICWKVGRVKGELQKVKYASKHDVRPNIENKCCFSAI